MIDTPLPRVLLIEDDEHFRAGLVASLRLAGATLQAFGRGVPALRALGEDAFDVVLTDLRLPDMDGLEVLAACRQDAEALVKLIDRDLAEGQELRIHISEQAQIDLYLDGQKKVGPLNPKLARHLLEIWFGYHSAARVLRQVLVDKIEVLKTPVSKPAK